MLVLKTLLIYQHFIFGMMSEYNQPVAKSLWSDLCSKGSYALNDCNWCQCDSQHQYACKARSCRNVDMFGHFNDAIRDIDVGMEGHGAWRSSQSACEPSVRYRRGALLCICTHNGTWPNPICRDNFRFLYPVEITKKNKRMQSCSATKLYLIDCNVCFCPSSGRINNELCTKNKCQKSDPIMDPDKVTIEDRNEVEDVYAQCDANSKYRLGCKTCTCLRNNRLLCDNCTDDTRSMIEKTNETRNVQNKSKNYCDDTSPGTLFNIDCNICYCDNNGLLFCTTKRCLYNQKEVIWKKSLKAFINNNAKEVNAPYENQDCVSGTKYMRGCNVCYCSRIGNRKFFICTVKDCGNVNEIDGFHGNCVIGTIYELNCLICRCATLDGNKWQLCQTDTRCDSKINTRGIVNTENLKDIDSLHGYCEPLHIYKKACNTCRCMSDGKSVVCTANVCRKPLDIEIIPVSQYNGRPCPNGHSYKVDCNICFCLSNGNAICTTHDCTQKSLQSLQQL